MKRWLSVLQASYVLELVRPHHRSFSKRLETFVYTELRKLYTNHDPRSPLFFWRDSNGREIDFLVDAGGQQLPIEVKAGMTIARKFFSNLDLYVGLSGGPPGALIYGGNEAYRRQGHFVRPWWACS